MSLGLPGAPGSAGQGRGRGRPLASLGRGGAFTGNNTPPSERGGDNFVHRSTRPGRGSARGGGSPLHPSRLSSRNSRSLSQPAVATHGVVFGGGINIPSFPPTPSGAASPARQRVQPVVRSLRTATPLNGSPSASPKQPGTPSRGTSSPGPANKGAAGLSGAVFNAKTADERQLERKAASDDASAKWNEGTEARMNAQRIDDLMKRMPYTASTHPIVQGKLATYIERGLPAREKRDYYAHP